MPTAIRCAASVIGAIRRFPDQHVRMEGTAAPMSSITLWTSPNLSAGSFIFLGIANTDKSGAWHYDDVGLTKRFYRATSQ
jgi:hypothetical protein